MKIIYFNDDIREFIEGLESDLRKSISQTILDLKEFGNNLGMPLSKPLGKGLFELRIKRVRIIYVFKYDSAILVHIFIKKNFKIPRHELEHALRKIKSLHNS